MRVFAIKSQKPDLSWSFFHSIVSDEVRVRNHTEDMDLLIHGFELFSCLRPKMLAEINLMPSLQETMSWFMVRRICKSPAWQPSSLRSRSLGPCRPISHVKVLKLKPDMASNLPDRTMPNKLSFLPAKFTTLNEVSSIFLCFRWAHISDGVNNDK